MGRADELGGVDNLAAMAAIEAHARDEREVLDAVAAVARTHAGRHRSVVTEVLRRELEFRGLDGWAVHGPALTALAEEISERPLHVD